LLEVVGIGAIGGHQIVPMTSMRVRSAGAAMAFGAAKITIERRVKRIWRIRALNPFGDNNWPLRCVQLDQSLSETVSPRISDFGRAQPSTALTKSR
jgi:hypothetical protein